MVILHPVYLFQQKPKIEANIWLSGIMYIYIYLCQWDPDPLHNLRNDFLRWWIHWDSLSTLGQIVGPHVDIWFQDIWYFVLPEKGEDQVTNFDDPFLIHDRKAAKKNSWQEFRYFILF